MRAINLALFKQLLPTGNRQKQQTHSVHVLCTNYCIWSVSCICFKVFFLKADKAGTNFTEV